MEPKPKQLSLLNKQQLRFEEFADFYSAYKTQLLHTFIYWEQDDSVIDFTRLINKTTKQKTFLHYGPFINLTEFTNSEENQIEVILTHSSDLTYFEYVIRNF